MWPTYIKFWSSAGLISGIQYNTYVSAINGVSDQVERNTSSLVIASSTPSPPPISSNSNDVSSPPPNSQCPHRDSGVSSYPSHAIPQCDMHHVSKDLCYSKQM